MNPIKLIKNNTIINNLEKYLLFIIISYFILLIGTSCNFIAIDNNSGKMPVINSFVDNEEHIGFFEKEEINNYYFSDIIKISILKRTFSIGDLLIFFSFILMIIYSFLSIKELIRRKRDGRGKETS